MANAQEKTGNKPGFTLAPGSVRIILMRPSIKVGEQSTGGLFEPNADWTDQAKQNLGKAIADAQSGLGNLVVPYAEPMGADGALAMEYRALFRAVVGSVIEYQFFSGNRLPTKKRKNSFEWTLGPEIAGLPGLAGADYALFIETEDQYGSTGRKMAQVVGALIPGISMPSGVHKGSAGLIDLKTGDLVWLNADLEMGGDVRTEEGASKRVSQLFEGFPGKTATVVPAVLPTAAAAAAVGN
ncbi:MULTISPECIES: hypothetical protein [unclassified Sphingomonas]|uniref:hypothetical protein n=1 Tax=unclassified Sphingomonas TaxID=196159 RepID=UPI0006FD9F11|nr:MULTISPECIES: hypothetical protein [unclassified Sphingomonas]KQX25908.1 hypothetical protein ASD17_00050 [Sphingomonas sp. Root1294]KQY68973.1 hypothetical protein ASD39_01245 [Sphingomonas sp. Root50]KRB89229.1 hypothetical protein ASE22_16160 [Sphingomonas sp. Root720]